MELPILIGNG